MGKFKVQDIINKIQLMCLFMFSLIWYINEKKETGKKYAIIFLIVFASIEFLKVLKNRKVYINKTMKFFLAFVVYCLFTCIWAINNSISFSRWFDLFIELGFVFLSFQFFLKQDNSVKKILKVVMYLGLFFSIYIFNYYGISRFVKMLLNGSGIGWGIGNTNAIGIKTCFSFLIFIYFAVFDRKYICYILSVLPLVISLGTGSKKVLIMLIIGVFFIIIKYKKNTDSFRSLLRFLFIICLILVIITSIFNSKYFQRIFKRFGDMVNDIQGTKEDGSTHLRKLYINAGIKSFLNHPIIGIGIDNSGYITQTVSSNFTYLHNNYIELLATTGIIGFLLYYYSYLHIIYSCLKNKENMSNMVFLIFFLLMIIEVGAVTYISIEMCWCLLLGYIFEEKGVK